MRRLDELLTAATERGEWTGPDSLIQHLERRLTGEREQVVAAPLRRATMVTAETRSTTPTEHPPRRRNRLALATAGFIVVAAAVVVAIAVAGGGDDATAPQTPTEVLTRLEASIAEIEGAALTGISTALDQDETDFLEWNLALGMNPDFTDCRLDTGIAGTTRVDCDVTMGEDYFFSRVLDQNLESMVVVMVRESGAYDLGAWPPPDGLVEAERDMRAWIQTVHPELESEMFGDDYAGVVKLDRRAGELHTQYLEEYLASR